VRAMQDRDDRKGAQLALAMAVVEIARLMKHDPTSVTAQFRSIRFYAQHQQGCAPVELACSCGKSQALHRFDHRYADLVTALAAFDAAGGAKETP
jgi:hypothetical protein